MRDDYVMDSFLRFSRERRVIEEWLSKPHMSMFELSRLQPSIRKKILAKAYAAGWWNDVYKGRVVNPVEQPVKHE